MTENEAIEVLNNCRGCMHCINNECCGSKECFGSKVIAIEALQEIQKYRAIGTIEECYEAMGKQKAKFPDIWGDGYADGQLVYDMYACPNCGENYEIDYDHYEYCPKCGQHMDKSDKVFE